MKNKLLVLSIFCVVGVAPFAVAMNDEKKFITPKKRGTSKGLPGNQKVIHQGEKKKKQTFFLLKCSDSKKVFEVEAHETPFGLAIKLPEALKGKNFSYSKKHPSFGENPFKRT